MSNDSSELSMFFESLLGFLLRLIPYEVVLEGDVTRVRVGKRY